MSNFIEKIRFLRRQIEKGAQAMDDTDALDCVELFPAWSNAGVSYTAEMRVRYDGTLYRVLQDHVSQIGWSPVDAPSLFAKVLIPDPEQIYPWERPDSTNTYKTGDKVLHNGQVWISIVDNNSWEPGVYGWEVVDADQD